MSLGRTCEFTRGKRTSAGGNWYIHRQKKKKEQKRRLIDADDYELTKSWNKATEAGTKKKKQRCTSTVCYCFQAWMHTQMHTHMGGQAHKPERKSTFSQFAKSIKHKHLYSSIIFNQGSSLQFQSCFPVLSPSPTGFTSLSSIEAKLTALEADIQPFILSDSQQKDPSKWRNGISKSTFLTTLKLTLNCFVSSDC